MAYKQLPTPESLRKLLRYDPDTGRLVWRERRPEHFSDGYFGAEHTCSKFNTRYAGKDAGTKHASGYVRVRINGKPIAAHRVAWAIEHGEWPAGEIDHINHDKADNRLANLRVVDRVENSRNKPLPCVNSSGTIGVYSVKGTSKWFAIIGVHGKLINLGTYDCIEDARKARLTAERQHGFHVNHGRQPVESNQD